MFDSHIQNTQAKSVLCVPVVNQNMIAGILYLENNLLPGAFSGDRVRKINTAANHFPYDINLLQVQAVQILSGQLAISYQNATLYKNLQVANELLLMKNKALVEFDQMKDQFLANTSHELRYSQIKEA